MAVRRATKEDLPLFLELWGEFLAETIENGRGVILPTEKTMREVSRYFDAYVSGAMRGVVLFGANDNAVTMWGELPEPGMDTLHADFAKDWGVYIRPENRGGGDWVELGDAGREACFNLGFRYAIDGVYPDGFGVGAIDRYRGVVTQVIWLHQLVEG